MIIPMMTTVIAALRSGWRKIKPRIKPKDDDEGDQAQG